jgi:hypothetical protein
MWRLSPIFLVAVAAHAQTVDGTLTDSITQVPIPAVIVTLLGPVRYNATTDDAGVFHFPEVHPGKYFLNIIKAGYVLPEARSGSFAVGADTRLSIEMDPLGRVEGRVRYPDGRPAPRAKVALNGEGHNYTGAADASGHFLLEDVVAGSYILRATAATLDPKADGEIWAPTYFPSTIYGDAAEPIPVANGLTATREIRLRSVPAYRTRGMVRDETGELAAGVTVRLEDQTVVTAADGIFEFVTRDGRWRLTAARKDADVERRGATTVFVSHHDVDNVDIRLALPFSVPLLIEGDKDTPAPGRPSVPQMLLLSPVDGVSQFVQAKPDGIPNVYPGATPSRSCAVTSSPSSSAIWKSITDPSTFGAGRSRSASRFGMAARFTEMSTMHGPAPWLCSMPTTRNIANMVIRSRTPVSMSAPSVPAIITSSPSSARGRSTSPSLS